MNIVLEHVFGTTQRSFPIDTVTQQVLPFPWAIVYIFKTVDFVLGMFFVI